MSFRTCRRTQKVNWIVVGAVDEEETTRSRLAVMWFVLQRVKSKRENERGMNSVGGGREW